jgi:hypothetical protein
LSNTLQNISYIDLGRVVQQKANDNNKIQQEPKAAPKETKSST